MDENKIKARLVILRKRLEQAKKCEDYGKAVFTAGQIFILENMLNQKQERIKKTTKENSNPEHGRSNTID